MADSGNHSLRLRTQCCGRHGSRNLVARG